VEHPADITLPVEGNPESGVRVTAFEDLQCEDSAAWRRMLDTVLLPRFSETVAFAMHDFPLKKHTWAMPAAIVSRRMSLVSPRQCLDFRRYCYEHLTEITAESFPEKIVAYAERAGLDPEDMSISVRNADFEKAVELDIAEGHRLQVVRTPTVMIGEERFIEVFGVGEVIAAIDKALRS
jgi:protein-disulfide isomerase